MNKDSIYYKQVQLLVRVLPLIAVENCFALKGGTAINLFYRDMPRLSVDIDLHFIPMDDRDTALEKIRAALSRISDRIKKAFPNVTVQNAHEQSDKLGLIVSQDKVRIKVELSPVIRGSVFPETTMEVSKVVQENFGYVEMAIVSFSDLYAGKICAALDRQHPRDLFDVKFLYDNEGISDDLRKTVLVYLISHHRPIAEVLDPPRKDITKIYESEFLQMAEVNVALQELVEVRERLITDIQTGLSEEQKEFLLSFKARLPKWELLALDGVKDLPSVKWKLINLTKMSSEKHAASFKKLEELFSFIKSK